MKFIFKSRRRQSLMVLLNRSEKVTMMRGVYVRLIAIMKPSVVVLMILLASQTATTGVKGTNGIDPSPIVILGSGFALAPDSPAVTSAGRPRHVEVVFRAENPNHDLAADGVWFELRLEAPDGSRITGRPVTIAQLLPTERRNVVVGLDLEPAGEPVASVQVSVTSVVRWRRVARAPQPSLELAPALRNPALPAVPGLTIIHASVVVNGRLTGISYPAANLTVTNPLDTFVVGMTVAVIAVDEAGGIIGGGQTSVDIGPHESVSPVIVRLIVPDFRAIARLEATAALPYLDLTPYLR